MKIRNLLLLPLLLATLTARAAKPPAELLQRAKQGDAKARTELSILYLEGNGVGQNESKGVEYLQSAAEQGDPEALFILGDCLMTGRGTKPDFRRAVASFRKAAEQGHTEAQRAMAFLYTRGIGVDKNPKNALQWQLRSEGVSETEIEARLAEEFPTEESLTEMSIAPKFRGGTISDFRAWILTRLRYPEEAVQYGIEGRVTIRFVVKEDGRPGDFEIVTSPHQSLADAVLSVLKTSPRWKPGLNTEGEPIPVLYTLPIDFYR